VTVPCGRKLHEYVNLYICARNPMMYKRQAQFKELCVLRVSPDVIDLPGVVITDGNASGDYVRFSAAPKGLAIVDRDWTFAEYWTDPDQITEWKKKAAKCAEVLVPDKVAPHFITGAYVACSEAQAALEGLVKGIAVEINSHLFSDREEAMVKVIMGDMFESKAQTLVNTVNCVGIMGKGVALEFKKRFPDMFEDYVKRCEAKQVRLGRPYLFKRMFLPWILNFPTKDHWRSVSRVQDIIEGLCYLQQHYKEWGISSLAVPPLGCGHGQLEWRVVGPTLYRHLKTLDIPVELYAPFGAPHEELQPSFLDESEGSVPQKAVPYTIDPAWVAIVEVLKRIEEEPFHWPVGRTTFQKIAYFASECGIPTGLKYQRGSYGPYAPALKERITALVNNGLLREEQLGRMFAIRVGQTFPDARRAYEPQIREWEPSIDKIADLFMRMNTQQAEVAATVHYASQEAKAHLGEKPTEKEILDTVMKWKQKRRPPLEEKEVAMTVRNLNMLSWIGAKVSDELPITEEDILHV